MHADHKFNWIIEQPGAWRATIEVLNPVFLDDLRFATSGAAEPIGAPKINIDPETEIKHIIQYELALELFKRYNNGKNFYDVIQDVIDFYEQRK
jgi:hypothetical protein